MTDKNIPPRGVQAAQAQNSASVSECLKCGTRVHDGNRSIHPRLCATCRGMLIRARYRASGVGFFVGAGGAGIAMSAIGLGALERSFAGVVVIVVALSLGAFVGAMLGMALWILGERATGIVHETFWQ